MNFRGNSFRSPSKVISMAAPAKINLYLNIIGKLNETYHELDSLVGFATYGDKVFVRDCEDFRLEISGPFSQMLPPEKNNLVIKAAKELARETNYARGAYIKLVKNLPISSGIGGGSADAAATLKALNRLWGIKLKKEDLMTVGLKLGSDVPVCVKGKPARIGGRGEKIFSFEGFPKCGILLVNPRVPIPTIDVFKTFQGKYSNYVEIPKINDIEALIEFLSTQKNDLQETSVKIAPVLQVILNILSDEPNCRLARVSGSGATCFGIFNDEHSAALSARAISSRFKEWWLKPTQLSN